MSAQWFDYPCPDCGTTLTVHEEHCEFEGTPRWRVEKAYIDILSVLTAAETIRETDVPDTDEAQAAFDTSYDWLVEYVDETPHLGGPADDWTRLHTKALHTLKRRQHVVERPSGNLHHIRPEDRERRREPFFGDIELVYEYGACDGCLDYGTCAMVSWCEMQEFSWKETKAFVVEWLVETGTWERGSFDEPNPEALVEDKRHVYDRGIGWADFAETTVQKLRGAGVIDD